jgi:hypothetical protein
MTVEPLPERQPGETWLEWRSRVRAEDIRRMLGGNPKWGLPQVPPPIGLTPQQYAEEIAKSFSYKPKDPGTPNKSLCQWNFHTPDDGTRLVHMQRYTSMQPQDGSRAIKAAVELIEAHQNRSHE